MKYPKKSKYGIPHFDAFACMSDSVSWQPAENNPHGFTLTATIVADDCTRPEDSECYSAQKTKAWQNDEWCYIGIVLSVSKNEVTLDNHAASLWGVECNYNARSNLHLAQVCKDLEGEALDVGQKVLDALGV